MEKDKKCFHCKRTYRGEGHEGHCTQSCYYSLLSCQLRKPAPKKKYVPSEKPKVKTPTPVDKELARIKRINDKWLKREVPLNSKPRYMLGEKLKRKHLYPDTFGGWDKRFRSCRG